MSSAALPPHASLWQDVAAFTIRVSGTKRNGEKATRKPSSNPPQLTRHASEDNGWRSLSIDQEMDDVEPGPSATALTAHDRLSQLNLYSKRNKENLRRIHPPRPPAAPRSFIDPQTNAQRVQWSQETQPVTNAPRASQIRRGKRPVPADDEDPGEVSEDQGFEQDQRTVDVQRKRKEAPTASRRSAIVPSPKRARFQERPRVDQQRLRSEEEDSLDATAARSQVPSSNYREVNQISKNLSRLHPPKPQSRTKWSPLEEDQLISLIKLVGCSWSRIKRLDEERGNILALRDQVALKDKARNMKHDFLKAGVQLPENFEGVTLSAKQREKLKELGVQDV